MSAPVPMKPAQNVAAALRGGTTPPVPRSEATQIEQSRAVAEVQAMVVVAQHSPRNEGRARMAMSAACGEIELASRAFFKFPRAGTTVSGASIHLATELARCWGNIDYGIHELRRDEERGESEMMAYAWDLQTNARARTMFIVPHKRDKKGGAEWLTDMRDIYENNANMGARRLREMIFRVIPSYLVEEAKALCHHTLETKGEGTPAERKKAMLAAFDALGISVVRLEAKIGSKSGFWTPLDLAGLRVSYGSLTRGEITADEEFPPVAAAAVADALKNDQPPPSPATPADDASVGADAASHPATQPTEAANSEPGAPPSEPGADYDPDPPWDAERCRTVGRAIIGDLMKAKTLKAVDNIIATRGVDLAEIKRASDQAYDHIMTQATGRKEFLAAGAA